MNGRRRVTGVLVALAIAGEVETALAQSPADRPPAIAPQGSPKGVIAPARVLMELRLGQLAAATAPAYRVGDEALVPVSSLLGMAEVRSRVDARGTLEATVQPGSVRLAIAATGDTARYGDRHALIGRELKLFQEGELYVAIGPLASLLRLEVVVDWTELAVTITNPDMLPLGRRVAREGARRSLREGDEGAAGPVLRYGLERPRWDGLVVDYTVSAPAADAARAASYSIAAGTNAFGGSLESTIAGVGMVPARSVRGTASWTGVWADKTWVKQVRMGDGVATGVAPRLVRGATVTNSPFMRPTQFDIDRLSGVLAPGWEIEAYRGGRLIAFDSTDAFGRYVIPVATQYGENAVDLVAYGPFGEVRHFNRMYRVTNELVPARSLEYGVSAGACADVRCTGTANVDIRYGVSPRWTVRAGYDGFQRDLLPALSHPYASISGAVTQSVGIQLEGVSRALARGLLRYEPSTRLRVAGEYTRFASADSIPVLTPAGWRARWLLSALVRPRGPVSSSYLEADAARVETVTGTTVRARLLTSGEWRDVRVSPYMRVERETLRNALGTSRSFVGVNASMLPRVPWGGPLERAWLRATLEAERRIGLSEASIVVARQFARGVRVEAGGRWTPLSAAATLLTAVDLPTMRSYTGVVAPRGGTTSATEYLQGSIVVNTATREVTLAPGPSVQRAGVAGRVFLDENTNGLLDVGESGVANVVVHVGTTGVTSDSTGWFEAWNVPPYELAPITVDSLSLPSPLWVVGFPTMTVAPGPNRFVVADVPIVPAGSIEGRVILDSPGGREGVGSALLTLIDRDTGARRRLTAFLDGEFLAVGVRPGRYEVTVDEQFLRQLGASADPTRFTLRPARDGVTMKGIDVILRHGTVAAADTSRLDAPDRATPVISRPTQKDAPAVPQGAPAAANELGPPPAPIRAAPPSPPPTSRRSRTLYVVRQHDTLRRIARRLLGAESRWTEIYRSNRARIKHPDLIRIGQRLVVDPSKRRDTRR